ncbi:MAG: hypothetical protein QM599_09685 [Pseudoxanthomonas sp.]
MIASTAIATINSINVNPGAARCRYSTLAAIYCLRYPLLDAWVGSIPVRLFPPLPTERKRYRWLVSKVCQFFACLTHMPDRHDPFPARAGRPPGRVVVKATLFIGEKSPFRHSIGRKANCVRTGTLGVRSDELSLFSDEWEPQPVLGKPGRPQKTATGREHDALGRGIRDAAHARRSGKV